MGGYGSGREASVYSGTVEEGLQIEITNFVKEGVIQPGCRTSGIITWKRFIGAAISIGYDNECFMENGHIQLNYRIANITGESQVLSYRIELMTTEPNYGGFRWWFVCPNQDCTRMVTKLYMPGGSKYFLCRTCQKLTYTSCRESGKYNSLYNSIADETGIDSKRVKQILKNLRG